MALVGAVGSTIDAPLGLVGRSMVARTSRPSVAAALRSGAAIVETAQLILGWALGAVALGVGAIALLGWLRPPMSKRWLDRGVLAGSGVALLAAAIGAIAVLTGHWPADSLHLLYAGIAVLALPVARAWGDEPRPGPMLLGGLVLLGIAVRLFQTG
jgi:hypothetical protein